MRRITQTILRTPSRLSSQYSSSSLSRRQCLLRFSSSNSKSWPSWSSWSSSSKPKFPPPTEAASVLFPDGTSTTTGTGSNSSSGLRVSRVGFGSPWMGAVLDRGLDMSRALSDGQCNLVQLTSEVKTVKTKDKAGKTLPVPEWPQRSWETRTFENLEIRREDLALVWELSAAPRMSAKDALNPSRAIEHLDNLLAYHELTYIDAFIIEIPGMTGGESVVNDYRRFTGEAVRLAMTKFIKLAGNKVKMLGFSWQKNPHMPHPGRAPDSPISDIIELRDLLIPSKPIVAMFPAGVGCGGIVDGSGLSNEGEGLFSLPEGSGVFQIGTSITHARRGDGRPFRLVDIKPRPIDEIMADLKSKFGMTIHLELEYSKRFEQQGQDKVKASTTSSNGGNSNSSNNGEGEEEAATPPPLPPKADVSWGHILAQNQGQLQGLDEWETICDSQIKPAVNRALDTLRIRGEAEGEWGFLYRSTLGSLMSVLSETMEVRKSHQLEEAAALMDDLAPSLRPSARGRDNSAPGESETVIGMCTAVALSSGVDCVLDQEFSASREAGRVKGFTQVPPDEVRRLYSGFRLPGEKSREKSK